MKVIVLAETGTDDEALAKAVVGASEVFTITGQKAVASFCKRHGITCHVFHVDSVQVLHERAGDANPVQVRNQAMVNQADAMVVIGSLKIRSCQDLVARMLRSRKPVAVSGVREVHT